MSIIEVESLTFIYAQGTPYARKALDDVSFSVEQGEFLGIVGANGTGKSTLVQHFNGLLQPTQGRVTVCGRDTSIKEHSRELWKKVGLVFQFPEQQMFADTVADEVAYGLKNLGYPKSEINVRVREALEQVGLDPEEVTGLSPLVLSGGMRRRVALASILVMQPEVLVLDEPTAGLDPQGRDKLLRIIKDLQIKRNTTVIMVSHSLSELITLADRLLVLADGKVVVCDIPEVVLDPKYIPLFKEIGLPEYLRLIYELQEQGVRFDKPVVTFEDAEREIEKLLRETMR